MRISNVSKIIVLLMLFLVFGSTAASAAPFSGGTGTVSDPYIVTTDAQLDAVRDNLSAHYRLGNDIDLTNYLRQGGAGYAKWNDAGWDPIGNWALPPYGDDDPLFNGSFDGNGYKITGLWINRGNESYVGLFGAVLDTSIIHDLGVEISSGGISGNDYVGGLVGALASYVNESEITDCYVTGSVSGHDNVGGLIGCGSVMEVIGRNWNIENCYSGCVVNGNDHVGGLVGVLGGEIHNSYAMGDVTGNNYVGGLVGSFLYALRNSYATGNIIGNNYVGGLAGGYNPNLITNATTTIAGCISTGNVTGNNYVGVFIGSEDLSSITECYRYHAATVNNVVIEPSVNWGLVTESHLSMPAFYFEAAAVISDDSYIVTTMGWPVGNGAWQWDDRGFPKLGNGDEKYPFPFSPVIPRFTVTFDSRGGSSVAPISSVQPGSTITEPSKPVNTGYTFIGWFRDPNTIEPWNFDTDTVTGDITLYAGWQLHGQAGFTVNFNSQGGSYVAPIINIQPGATIMPPDEPTRDGYIFTDWYTNLGETNVWDFENDTVTGDITLYAGWSKLPEGGGGGCNAAAARLFMILAALPLLFAGKRR